MWLAAILAVGILTMWVPARWALSVFQVALFVLAAVRIVQRRSLTLPFAGWMITGAAAWGAFQAAAGWSVDRVTTRDAALSWMTNLAAFMLAADLYRNVERRERFLRLTLIFTSILAVVSIFTFLTSPAGKIFWIFDSGSAARTLGPFVYQNQYAAFVEAVLPVAIVGIIRDRTRWMLYAAIVAMLFGAVVTGGSRTGTILCLAEILAIPIIAFGRGMINGSSMLARVMVGSLAAVVVLTGVVGWEPLWKRLQEPHPYSLRKDLALSSIAMVRDRPVSGFGLGTWPEAYPGYARFDDGTYVNQAHNDWIQWASEGGLPFLALMLAIAGWSVGPAVRSLWGVGILSVWLHALVDYPMQQRPALAAFFFALLGALAATTATTSETTARADVQTIPRLGPDR